MTSLVGEPAHADALHWYQGRMSRLLVVLATAALLACGLAPEALAGTTGPALVGRAARP
jgi:hypothetical protein